VSLPDEALRQAREALSALAEDRRCNVCRGLSPTWDGHDKSPMCRVTALDVLARVLSPERDEALRQEGREHERAKWNRHCGRDASHLPHLWVQDVYTDDEYYRCQGSIGKAGS